MLRIILFFIAMLLLPFYYCCTKAVKEVPNKTETYSLKNISQGLPSDGMWRQNLELFDFNGDGFLDILTPPPRKASEDRRRPFIFLWGNEHLKWEEGKYKFPKKIFNYGGIAAGDINSDGYPDIVLAIHTGKIVLLLNDGKDGFTDVPLPVQGNFFARTVSLSDINDDGWLDIIALSEAPFRRDYQPRGILVAINKQGNGWDMKFLGEHSGLFGDSMAVGDINGDGKKDIAVASLTLIKESQKIIWFGDGKGEFKDYGVDFIGNTIPFFVRINGSKERENTKIGFILSEVGKGARVLLSVFQWSKDSFQSVSSGLEMGRPIVFDFSDLDVDGKNELVVLSQNGIHFYTFLDMTWVEKGNIFISPNEIQEAQDVKLGRNRDGSIILAYSLASEDPDMQNGIRAYRINYMQ